MPRRGQFHYPEKLNKTKPSRVRYVRFVKVISLFGAICLVEVVCPTQHESNLKGRCLFIWPLSPNFFFFNTLQFDGNSTERMWSRRSPGSILEQNKTVQSQQVLACACVRVLVLRVC